MSETFTLRVYRGTTGEQHWEDFEIALHPRMNIISALMAIEKHPKNIKGESVAPVVWEGGCLEEVCGSCSMLINGQPRQACTALIRSILEQTKHNVITLAPFTKFPLVRDLIVDREPMFEGLKKVHGWIEVDDTYDRASPPLRISQAKQDVMYSLSTCMTCGCCSEACPQVGKHSKFIGPAAISQARLFNAHPVGKLTQEDRLRPLMEEGGINDCGNSQNCVQVCPKGIPLTDSIAAIGRDVTLQALRDLFSLPDRD